MLRRAHARKLRLKPTHSRQRLENSAFECRADNCYSITPNSSSPDEPPCAKSNCYPRDGFGVIRCARSNCYPVALCFCFFVVDACKFFGDRLRAKTSKGASFEP